MTRIRKAHALIDQFEAGSCETPRDAERLIVEIFEACGHDVYEKGFVGEAHGADCFVRALVDGKLQTIAVEVKSGRHPADDTSVLQALHLKATGHFDRAMVVSRQGFSAAAHRHAETAALGKIDLFGPTDLRSWLARQVQPDGLRETYEQIIRSAMRRLVRLVAEYPEQLAKIEWRELEKLLREAFEGIGFDTKLTRPGKDGGFDLELTVREDGAARVFLVEVKHWTDQRPGASHLKKFVSVSAAKKATGGLFLSTSGFTGTICSGIAEISVPIWLGDGNKVVALCKTYLRLRSALWVETENLQDILLSGTRRVSQAP